MEALQYRVFWLYLSPAKSKVAKDSTLNFSGSLLFTASSLPSLPAVALTSQFLFLPPGLCTPFPSVGKLSSWTTASQGQISGSDPSEALLPPSPCPGVPTGPAKQVLAPPHQLDPQPCQTLWPTHLSLGLHAWHAWLHPLALVPTLTSSSPGQNPIHDLRASCRSPSGLLQLLSPPPSLCCAVLSLSVVSDSLRSHGLQPTRLLCPWGFSSQEY